MKKTFLIFLIIFLVTTTFACDCVTPDIQGRYSSSDIVIKGKVLSKVLVAKNDTIVEYKDSTKQIETITVKFDKKAYFEYSIYVIQSYKGKIRHNIIKIRTEAYSNCSSHFEIDKEYFFFSTKKRGKYFTNLCSGNEFVNQEVENKLLELKKAYT